MEVKCFGIARDIASADHITIDRSITSVAELRSYLQSVYPDLSKLKSYMVAVDQSYASDDQLLSESSEIAIIPPVSGG